MQTALSVCCVAVLLLGLLWARPRHAAWRVAWALVFVGFAAYKGSELLRAAIREIAAPPLWDFKVFWMVGQICRAGHNVYDIASYEPFRTILNPGNDLEFNTIALKIGMPYPPPAAALFCPLGNIANLQTAMSAWYLLLFIALVLCIVGLWRQFLRGEGPMGLIVVAVLVLSLPATTKTVDFGQLNFFAVLLLLQIWRERIPWRAGMWLAPLLVLRPLCVLLAVYFVVRRQWSALVSLVVTSVVLFVVSVPIIGVNGLLSYFHHNPTQRYPEIYFKGSESLYRMFVTAAGKYDGFFSLSAHPWFVFTSVVLLAAATYICWRSEPSRRNICLSMLLALGLFLYPNSGTHYSVILLVPLFSMWHERHKVGVSDGALVAFLTLQYVLFIYRDGAVTTGVVFALDAAMFAALALRERRRRAQPARETPLLATA